MPKLYKKLIDIIALLCLSAVFLFTFSYLKSWWTEEIGEKRQEQNIWKEKVNRNLVKIIVILRWCPNLMMRVKCTDFGSRRRENFCELTDMHDKRRKEMGKGKICHLPADENVVS
ncbi:MAG: hypothetical protein ACLTS6_13110 [Anaerobutyricum sp.]